MTDSLFHPSNNICEEDTVQFKVINSQTQDANAVKISFKLPLYMSIVSGHTQLRMGNGTFVTVADQVLNAGSYT